MSELKTIVNDASVEDFLNSIQDETKRSDSFKLLDLFKKETGVQPKMWDTSIVGFGMFHYKSKRSSQEGDWPLIAFSPRKQNLTLYVTPGMADISHLLTRLGKHKTSKGCLYINKLADVDMNTLEEIVAKTYQTAKKQYNT